MSKKQFTLDSWLKDKSQKVVTRCGFPVRIVCTDVKRKDYPILALVERDDQEEYQSFTKDGRFSLYNPLHDNFDLFIETADEFSEDEKILEIIKHCIESRYLHTSTIKGISQKQCLAWLGKQGQVKESTISQHENRTCEGNGNSLTYEDEKVRKEIINYFQCQSEEEPTRKEIHDKWIAWLENIPVTIDHEKRDGFHLGYKAGLERLEMKTAEESLDIDSDTYNKIVDECIFGEQKPKENKGNIGGISPNSEWSEEDDWMKKKIMLVLLGSETFLTPEETNELVYWLKSLQDRVQPQPKQWWSEEDEQHIDSLLKRLDALCRNKFERTRFAISEDRDWLKSIKDRVQPQPKQEWSEEDEKRIKKVMHILSLDGRISNEELKSILDWLKSLRPQNRWKPSDEQMEALNWHIGNTSVGSWQYKATKELMADLKKLKEKV